MQTLLKVMTPTVTSLVLFLGLSASAHAQQLSPFALDWVNTDTEGAQFASEDYPDSVIVLELFQTNCSACNRNAPNIDLLAEDFADQKVQVADVGVAQSRRSLDIWIARHNPNHAVVAGKRSLMEEIGLRATPTTVVLDCNLNVQYKTVGLWSRDTKAAVYNAVELTLATQECDVPDDNGDIEPFALEQHNADGPETIFASEDHPDTIFVFEVFQTLCGACNVNAPNVNDLAARYADAAVKVLDIGYLQNPRELAQWISRHDPNHPVLAGTLPFLERLNVRATPTTLIFDQNLKLAYTHVGVWDDPTRTAIEEVIDGLLAPEEEEPVEDEPVEDEPVEEE